MKDKPDMRKCPKCGVETYAYKASKTHDRTLYFHPGTCKKAAFKNGF